MSHHHLSSLSLSLFIMTLLSSTTLLCVNAGGSLAPTDFSPDCVDDTPNQETFADVDAYETLDQITSIDTRGWTATDEGVCDFSFTVCSNDTDAENNSLALFFDKDFYPDGPNDPFYVETVFSCTNCPDCSLQLQIYGVMSWAPFPGENIAYNCTDGTEPFTYTNENDDNYGYPQFEAIFGDTTNDTRCITIERVRVYQYQDCTDDVFNLTIYTPIDPGVGISNGTCVANAVADSTPQAACSDFSEWDLVPGSDICECSSGFEPNDDITACDPCGANYYKEDVGNMACEMCPLQQVATADRTGCECAEGYSGTNCMDCAEDFFSDNGGGCIRCPDGSIRESGDPMTNCTCTGNLVTATEQTMTTSDICENCAYNYFMTSGGMCQRCPDGSNRMLDDQTQCVCNDTLVTSNGDSTTDDVNVPCNNCPANNVLIDDVCESCPLFSSRLLTSSPDVCTCNENTVTANGNSETVTDPCTECREGYSRESPQEPCTAVVVTFSNQLYTFSENETILISITAEPPPTNDIIFTVTISNADSDVDVAAILKSSESSIDVTFEPFADDSIALQEPRLYTVMFITESMVDMNDNTAQLTITDNDVVVAQFAQSSYTYNEGDGSGKVCVELTTQAAVDITVRILGSSNEESPSASVLDDLNEELVFVAMTTLQKCFMFEITDDNVIEDSDEVYSISLERVSPADDDLIVSDESSLIAIIDNDKEDGSSSSLPIEAIIGACVGGAVVAIISALLCILCLCIWRFNVKRQGFYHTYEDSQTAPTMLRYSASLRSISSQSVVPVEGKRASQKENEFFV